MASGARDGSSNQWVLLALLKKPEKESAHKHHEQTHSTQNGILQSSEKGMWYPSIDDSNDLLIILDSSHLDHTPQGYIHSVLSRGKRLVSLLAPKRKLMQEFSCISQMLLTHDYGKVLISTVDCNVYIDVSCICSVAAVQQIHTDERWVAFASSKSFRSLPAHEIAFSLGS